MGRDLLSRMRREADRIFKASVEAVDPYRAVRNFVRLEGNRLLLGLEAEDAIELDMETFDRIFVIGGGKATAPMARAVEDLLADQIREGLVNVKYGFAEKLRHIRIVEAGHPVPDRKGIEGTRGILQILEKAGDRDLVFSLISGGGSALLPQPSEGIGLPEKQEITRMLLECGASIDEINAVRKHISSSKGGQMARAAFPATVVNLMLSDVVGDKMDVIASGPFVPDSSTFGEVRRILEKYRLEKIPPSIASRLKKGAAGEIPDTPKQGDPVFNRIHNFIVGSNILALRAAARQAQREGYGVLILSSMVEGETREVARVHSAVAKEVLSTGEPLPAPACVISGGETTVTIRGNGLGGRNQEFCLAAALDLEDLAERVVILSGGTDGNDGPTDAAGAVVDPSTVAKAREMGLSPENFLENNDSYRFFEQTGDLLKTGPTKTNVMDVRLVLVR